MSIIPEKRTQTLSEKFADHFRRYGLGASALIATVELIWAASVLIPVLFVIGTLFQFTNAWLSVLPGFLGALTFLILLTIGGLAAALPSTYVSKWRGRMLDRIEDSHPIPVAVEFRYGPEIQDAD